jgi:hypothetical protein
MGNSQQQHNRKNAIFSESVRLLDITCIYFITCNKTPKFSELVLRLLINVREKDTGNIEHTKHRNNKKTQFNTEN